MRKKVYSVPEFIIEAEAGRFYLVDRDNASWEGDEIDGGYVNKMIEKISGMNFDEAQAYVTEEKINKRIVLKRKK